MSKIQGLSSSRGFLAAAALKNPDPLDGRLRSHGGGRGDGRLDGRRAIDGRRDGRLDGCRDGCPDGRAYRLIVR